MSFTRSASPIWFFDNLTGAPFDDTYYAFFLTNTLPYLPQTVYEDPNGVSPWGSPLEFNASSGLPENLFFNPSLVYRIEFRQGPTQNDPLIWLVEDYVPTPVVNPGLAGQLAFYATNGVILSGGGVGNIAGTTTNDNAAAGNVGEFISSTILSAGAVSLTSTVTANITSIPLTAGDWNVWGNIATTPGSGTTTSNIQAWINTVSASAPVIPNGGAYVGTPAYAANLAAQVPVGMMRLSLPATTTVYLSIDATFAVSTLSAYGFIGARRAR